MEANSHIQDEVNVVLKDFPLTRKERKYAKALILSGISLYVEKCPKDLRINTGAELLINTLKSTVGTILGLAKMEKK